VNKRGVGEETQDYDDQVEAVQRSVNDFIIIIII